MKEYKEFTEGTFYDKLKQCIKEGYDVPSWDETQTEEMQSKFRGRLVCLYYSDDGLNGNNYIYCNYIYCNGRFVGVREKKQRSCRRKPTSRGRRKE